MKYVAQEDEMGCAIACVANLLQFSYQGAKKLFDPKHAKIRGYYCKSIVNVLKKVNIQSHYKKYSDEINFMEGDIVFFEPNPNIPYGHWMLKINEGWVDPWINLTKNAEIKHAQAGIRKTISWKPEWLLRIKKSQID